MIASLPLFHRIAGQPVVVLGEGEAGEAKRRLVERAGGEVVGDLEQGIASGARLAFVAHDDRVRAEAAAARARAAGLLVNVTDRPELCDFTVPSILDRSPVLVAIGTGGASAGLAKALRLRLEALLPQGLGALADRLFAARGALRARWPDTGDRRRALDFALGEGGTLNPLREGSAERVSAWLTDESRETGPDVVEITVRSADPDELTLREARLLGMADAIVCEPGVPPAILHRARADAIRLEPALFASFRARGTSLVVRLTVDRTAQNP
jgi:uroporphyrin-III C-methyltransferase/precorrin-2 dehydrogenase/sirohydrochlorin ferrochelatase